MQHLVKLEQDLEQASERFFKTLKLIIIDSIGSVFAPIVGGTSNVGHSLLVSVVQILQVHAPIVPSCDSCLAPIYTCHGCLPYLNLL
jgi:hypothetical protein